LIFSAVLCEVLGFLSAVSSPAFGTTAENAEAFTEGRREELTWTFPLVD
jgi:hypothetical protein